MGVIRNAYAVLVAVKHPGIKIVMPTERIRLLCGKCGRLLVELNDRDDYVYNTARFGSLPNTGRRVTGANRPGQRQVESWGIKELGLERYGSHLLTVRCHPRCGAVHSHTQERLIAAVDRARAHGRAYVMSGDGKAAVARGGRDI